MTLRDKYRALLSGAFSQQSILPSGYKRVEYIYNDYSGSTKCPYLSIPNYITINSKISIECTIMNESAAFLFGFAHRGYTSGCQLKPENLAFCGRWGNSSWTVFAPFSINKRTKLIFENGKITLDDVIYEFPRNATNVESSIPICIFARNYQNTTDYNVGGVKLYSFSIDDSINLIPCLDNNNRPCMYDTVSKQTFYNQGEGEFLYKLAENRGGGTKLLTYLLNLIKRRLSR